MKKITITEIAHLANVSIGTVDRAINGRPGINPETKKKILAIAQQHNYQPNRLSKALAHHKQVRIGVITLPTNNPFVNTLIHSAKSEETALYDYGCRLVIRSLTHIDTRQEAELISRFIQDGIDALAIGGIDHPKIVDAINRAVEHDIPVAAFNTDVPESRRVCFIGQDLYRSGMVAAALLGKFMGGKGRLFILQGHHDISAHRERLAGFEAVVKTDFPQIEIAAIEECSDEDQIAYTKTKNILERDPTISGIYTVAGGSIAAGQVIKECRRAGTIKMVCNDYISGIRELLDSGIIDATILQDPITQGSLPIRLLFNYVFDGIKPDKEMYHTAIQVVTKYHKIPIDKNT